MALELLRQRTASVSSPERALHVADILKQITDAYREERSARLQIAQLIPLNLLLPLATSVFLFLFGRRENGG